MTSFLESENWKGRECLSLRKLQTTVQTVITNTSVTENYWIFTGLSHKAIKISTLEKGLDSISTFLLSHTYGFPKTSGKWNCPSASQNTIVCHQYEESLRRQSADLRHRLFSSWYMLKWQPINLYQPFIKSQSEGGRFLLSALITSVCEHWVFHIKFKSNRDRNPVHYTHAWLIYTTMLI